MQSFGPKKPFGKRKVLRARKPFGARKEGIGEKRSPARRRTPLIKKRCFFCGRKQEVIDYKTPDLLRQFTTEKGKILNCSYTGTCSRHQRLLGSGIKRARFVALLPYVGE
ncbi:MAG: 30S ribosomal protein S18 [Candidatus Aureabacteria bacterium]|nr:30S ribosomal protein S18 [Candidatus Auribacterota bacterium]